MDPFLDKSSEDMGWANYLANKRKQTQQERVINPQVIMTLELLFF